MNAVTLDVRHLKQSRFGFNTRVRLVVRKTRRIVMAWRERSKSRRQLGSLNDHLLRDIGKGRMEAEMEASKFFWMK